MSQQIEQSTSPVIPPNPMEVAEEFVKLSEDPGCAVLFSCMKIGWQIYYSCHMQMIQHIARLYPEMDVDTRAALATRVVQAAVAAARAKPPTAEQLYEAFKVTCEPVLCELAANEIAAKELEKSNES